MKRFFWFFISVFFVLAVSFFTVLFFSSGEPAVTIYPKPNAKWWTFQSIDTMKHSRDLAREKLRDASYDAVIDREVRSIAETGATHVAIATPYDEEFAPYLVRWVSAARTYHLGVWFRGNFSGWEGWFGYPNISRVDHLAKTQTFIRRHKDLFRDGDVFSACPECENGGPGDPRSTGDVDGYRKFLKDEYAVMQAGFEALGKHVVVNFFSMNGDIARLIMDRDTTHALGGTVTVDHYVKTPENLATDAGNFIKRSDGTLVLGEFGAPIPDINGDMTQAEQSGWLRDTMMRLIPIAGLEGMNYWTQTGSSTALWEEDGRPRAAVATLKAFFRPRVFFGVVRDELGMPIANASVSAGSDFSTKTNQEGYFELRVPDVADALNTLSIEASGFVLERLSGEEAQMSVILLRTRESWWFRLEKWMKHARETW